MFPTFIIRPKTLKSGSWIPASFGCLFSLFPQSAISCLVFSPSFLFSTYSSSCFGHLWCAFNSCWLASVLFLLCSCHPFQLFGFFHLIFPPSLWGFWPVSRCFLSSFFLPPLPPSSSISRSPQCPLIFMRLTGQPCSASLSLSVGEEAAHCQQLMDFWKT